MAKDLGGQGGSSWAHSPIGWQRWGQVAEQKVRSSGPQGGAVTRGGLGYAAQCSRHPLEAQYPAPPAR